MAKIKDLKFREPIIDDWTKNFQMILNMDEDEFWTTEIIIDKENEVLFGMSFVWVAQENGYDEIPDENVLHFEDIETKKLIQERVLDKRYQDMYLRDLVECNRQDSIFQKHSNFVIETRNLLDKIDKNIYKKYYNEYLANRPEEEKSVKIQYANMSSLTNLGDKIDLDKYDKYRVEMPFEDDIDPHQFSEKYRYLFDTTEFYPPLNWKEFLHTYPIVIDENNHCWLGIRKLNILKNKNIKIDENCIFRIIKPTKTQKEFLYTLNYAAVDQLADYATVDQIERFLILSGSDDRYKSFEKDDNS